MAARGELAYLYKGRLYLNLTHRCPTACRFGAKHAWDWTYRGSRLLLGREPTVGELLDAARCRLPDAPSREIIFCGFGEPTERLATLLDLSEALRSGQPGLSLRLNTVGLGTLSNRRDIVPELAAVLDSVSVSLNTADAAQWRFLHRPRANLAAAGFCAVCDFIRGCVQAKLETTVTAVEQPGVDLAAVAALSRRLGAGFRLRPQLVDRPQRAGS
ncbi:MAG: TatD family nuclease-associated radical SAM protein [Elusimicrobia bacterium]|nr:TatD family nuclease-associated radical SAM protein [Elusimicrobiota bacterium]